MKDLAMLEQLFATGARIKSVRGHTYVYCLGKWCEVNPKYLNS